MRDGFSLIELIVIMSVLILLAAASFPLVGRFTAKAFQTQIRDEYISALELAKSRARAGVNDSDHGVFLNTSTMVLYQGPSYAFRSTTFDYRIVVPSSVRIGGNFITSTDSTFQKYSGAPVSTSTVIFFTGAYQTTISVNERGVIDVIDQ